MKNISQDYMDDILVRMSHHSSAIENNTLTLPETVSIILHNTVPNKASLREVYEIDNHRYAMEYLYAASTLQEELTLDILFKTDELLMDKLHHERGMFKTKKNFIRGAEFDTASPQETPMLMKQWIDNVNYRLEVATSKADVIELACESHIEFERIHPFADGNGRTGRLLMNFLLLKKNIAPFIIDKKDKERYVYFLATQDVADFCLYAEEKIQVEEKRMAAFSRNELNQDFDIE